MKRMSFLFLVLALVAGVLGSGCNYSVPSEVQTPGLGGATVGKYVAIGNSLTSGYQSNALYESAQIYSYPNLIAQQLTKAGATIGAFRQPIWSDPGSFDATTKASRYELIQLRDANGNPVIGPRGLNPGAPSSKSVLKQYDNMGIPGAVLSDFVDASAIGTLTAPARRGNIFFPHVMGSQATYGSTILAQVDTINKYTPIDLITFWLGNNDVLGFATSGGISPTSPTPTSFFATTYKAALDSLTSHFPNAKIVVANIPNVKAVPFFTTIGPKVAAGVAQAMAANPAIQGLFFQKHGENRVATGLTQFSEATPPLITLKGGVYAGMLGAATGQFYRDFWAANSATLIASGFPNFAAYYGYLNNGGAGIDTTKPFGFHPQNPWPDALTLDADEQATAASTVTAFNTTISNEATAHRCGLVDVFSVFNSIKANGYASSGLLLKTDYITGGIFSLDGVHPSSMGAGVVANEFIRVINAQFGMHVPMVNLANLPGIPTVFALSKSSANGKVVPIIPFGAFKSFEMLFPTVTTY